MYNGILPKGTCPFVYLRFECFLFKICATSNTVTNSLHIDPQSVDVNVHPTKREVHFLDEEYITQKVCDAIQEALVVNSGSRTFQYQVWPCSQCQVTSCMLIRHQTLLTGGVLGDKESAGEKTRDPEDADTDDACTLSKCWIPRHAETVFSSIYAYSKESILQPESAHIHTGQDTRLDVPSHQPVTGSSQWYCC